jgi:hypothetical protein
MDRECIMKLKQMVCLGLAFIALSDGSFLLAKSWRFGVIGDHRSGNKAGDVLFIPDPQNPKGKIGIGYKDGGIAKPILQDLATALKNEDVEFVLNVGDLVSKWRAEINGKTADVLLAEELAEWANIWNTNSDELPIYPVRGNQEVSASKVVWQEFITTLPGIGQLRPNGPAGEENLTYAFKYRNCLFVGVDQYVDALANGNTHLLTPQAQVWLDQTLSESDKPFKFVFGHVPAFETWDATSKLPFTVMKDGLASSNALFSAEFIALRNAFWSSLTGAGAEYFCGHEHIYSRGFARSPEGWWVRQTIIGDGGAPAGGWDTPFPADYAKGPFVESYTGIPFPTVSGQIPVELKSPWIVSETAPRTKEYGYIVIEVLGSRATAAYKAESSAGAGFHTIETWNIPRYFNFNQFGNGSECRFTQ